MSKVKKMAVSLLWVLLGLFCVIMIPFMWWMLFNPLEPYVSIVDVVGETVFTLVFTLVFPVVSVICFERGLNLEE